MDSKYQIIINELGPLRVKSGINLKNYFGQRFDQEVELFFMATTQTELIKVIALVRELDLDFLIIGTGTKIIFPSDFKGIIINNKTQNLKIFGVKGKVSVSGIGVEEAMVEADSGVLLSKLAMYANNQNLTGLEILETKNGTIGGSIMNDWGIESLEQVKILDKYNDIINKKINQVETEDIILSAIFKLKAKK